MKKLVMTWDYRMRWAAVPRPLDYRSGGWPYAFGEDVFLEDYMRCIDFLSAHGYDGIVPLGFLRDSHGGERAARALCDYAVRRGIRVLAPIGVACYGGAYWEGEHRFNLDTFLRKDPSLAAVDPAGNRICKGQNGYSWSIACPSQPLVVEWTTEAVEWLIKNFDIGGFEFQSGDYGVCACPRCRQRTGDDRAAKFSFVDVADLVNELMKTARAADDDLLLTTNVYMAVREGRNFAGAALRDGLPDYAYVTWWCGSSPVCMHPEPAWPTFDCDLVKHVDCEAKADDIPLASDLPGRHNIGQLVVGTSAYYSSGYIAVEGIARMASLAHRIGLDGLMVYADLGDFTSLVNYLATEAFLRDPQMSLLEFWRWAEGELAKCEAST